MDIKNMAAIHFIIMIIGDNAKAIIVLVTNIFFSTIPCGFPVPPLLADFTPDNVFYVA